MLELPTNEMRGYKRGKDVLEWRDRRTGSGRTETMDEKDLN